MAVRLTVLNALAKLGYLPNHPDYDFHVKKHLIKEFKLEQKSSEEASLLNDEVSKFVSKIKGFYTNKKIGNRDIEYLKQKKANWLSLHIKNPKQKESQKQVPKKKRKKKPGRKKKLFSENAKTQQNVKASKTKGDKCLEELIHAAILKADKDGQSDVTWVLRQLVNNPDEGASKFRQAMKRFNMPDVVVFTPEEALALIIELRLSKNSYTKLRIKAKNKHAHLYPSYDPAVTDYMKKCKPKNIDLTKSDEVKQPMQSALDHQLLNILELPSVVKKHADLIKQCEQSGLDYELKMFFKYGADGTSNQSQYQSVTRGL